MILTFFLAIVSGCDKPLTLDVDFEGEKPVIFSLINPGEPIVIYVSKSGDPYQSGVYKNDNYITDAQVAATEDGEPFGSFVFNDVHLAYVGDSSFLPETGKEYRVIVETSQFGVINSVPVVIPDTISMEIEVINTGEYGGLGQISEITFSFRDPIGKRNHYGYNLYPDDYGRNHSLHGFTWMIDQTFDEKCHFYRNGISSYGGSVFDDFCFDGLTLTLKVSSQIQGSAPFVFRFYFFDPDLFGYYKGLSLYNEAQFESGYFEPVRVTGNVEGGYGIVAGFNYTERIVILGE